MVRYPLQSTKRAAVVSSGERGAAHQAHVGPGCKFCCDVCRPILTGPVCNLDCFTVQPTTGQIILVHQNNVRTAFGSRQCRHQPGRPRANHQNIAMGKGLIMDSIIGLTRQRTQPGGPANKRFVQFFPESRRPHEGFVIKSGPQKRRQQVVGFHDVKIKRRKPVLAGGGQTAIKFLCGGAYIWRDLAVFADLHQRIGFL